MEFDGDDKNNGRIDEGLLNAINDEINALEFDTLSDQSNINTGYPQAQLEIWYDDGKYKKIQDEEMESSLRLSGICEMFHGLLWVKDVWKPWCLDSLNDSSYLSLSRSFRDAHNRDVDWYSERIYKDTVSKKGAKPEETQMYFAFDTLGIDPYDTLNIYGNYTFLIGQMAFIQINKDHSFTFGQTGEPTMLSVGFWKNKKDTIELNWDLDKTLFAVKDGSLCKRYLHCSIRPVPLTIEGWKLVYRSKNKKVLKGLGAKKDEE